MLWYNDNADMFNTFLGKGPRRMQHWENWSCPDAETYITGIDHYDHPRLCALKMQELYPEIYMHVPETDDPQPRPWMSDGDGTPSADRKGGSVRWGGGSTSTFIHGEAYFKTPEEVFAFSPLAKGNFNDWGHVVDNGNYSDREKFIENSVNYYRKAFNRDKPLPGSAAHASCYNTMFMWPLLCFGWELFLECCLDEQFERIMDEFAEISRTSVLAMAASPVNIVHCHDDIMTTRGPVCSPEWMRKYIFPRYEEFFGILNDSGKIVVFTADGNMDAYADDVIACGAKGIRTEPYTDFKALARKHKDIILVGEGDVRVLMRNDDAEIKAMVESMAETGRMSGGYFMGIGNSIVWNAEPEGVKRYLDYSNELAYRW